MKGSTSKAVADGIFYIIIESLAKGTYPIHFKSSLLCIARLFRAYFCSGYHIYYNCTIGRIYVTLASAHNELFLFSSLE
jgi:hypothetical protein